MTSRPEAHLSVRKSRVKKYGDKYYLQNGTEFEIELFNPTQKTVCAAISINGVDEPNGLVIRPGQRVFLERFIGNPNKLKFDTYEVESGNSQVQAAIAKNGHVVVQFYNEKKVVIEQVLRRRIDKSSDPYGWKNPWVGGGNNLFFHQSSGTGNPNLASFTTTSNMGNSSSSTFNVSSSFSDEQNVKFGASMDSLDFAPDFEKATPISSKIKTQETGRIEEGSQSSQLFETVDMKFETWATETVSFQILPYSSRPAESIAMYCSNCGRKARKGEKFCPDCGNNLEAQRKSLGIKD
jgi:hypothetical protein